jgi:hypothetical protein
LTPVELEWDLPQVGWTGRVIVRGLDATAAALAQRRWPIRSRQPAQPSTRLELEATGAPVGLARGPFVTAQAFWKTRRDLDLQVRAAHLEMRCEADIFQGVGQFSAFLPLASLDAAFRAVSVLALERRGAVVLHASAVRRGTEVILFVGASGAGKTTTARRLGREGMRRIADDMVCVDLRGAPLVHGLPFDGRRQVLASVDPAAGGSLRTLAFVSKGAAAARMVPASDAPARLAEAFIGLEAAPGEESVRLERFEALCQTPFARFDVPPSGRLIDAVAAWLDGLPPEPGHQAGRAQESHPVGSDQQSNSMPPPIRVERLPDVAWRVIDGVAVLVKANSARIHTLNPVGTRIWELSDGREVDAIAMVIVNEFKVGGTEALADVRDFVIDLEGRGFLRRTG